MTIHSLVVSGAARIRNYCLLMLFTGFVLSCSSLRHADQRMRQDVCAQASSFTGGAAQDKT
jgi:hypothetical protein